MSNRKIQDIGIGAVINTPMGQRPVDEAFIAHYSSSPAAAATNSILAAVTLLATCPISCRHQGIAQPPSVTKLTVKGNAAGITGNVVVVGTDSANAPLTNTIALDGTTEVLSAGAFKTITSVVVPARNASGDIVSVGYGTSFVSLVAITMPSSGTYKVLNATITQPDVIRGLQIKGTGASCTGNVVIYGTNGADQAISSTIAANGTDAVAGLLAFKTVTRIDLPVKSVSTDTIAVGCTDVLGLPHLLTHNTVLKAVLNNAVEAVAPTVTTDASLLEKNTVDLASALDGNKVDVYYLV